MIASDLGRGTGEAGSGRSTGTVAGTDAEGSLQVLTHTLAAALGPGLPSVGSSLTLPVRADDSDRPRQCSKWPYCFLRSCCTCELGKCCRVSGNTTWDLCCVRSAGSHPRGAVWL